MQLQWLHVSTILTAKYIFLNGHQVAILHSVKKPCCYFTFYKKALVTVANFFKEISVTNFFKEISSQLISEPYMKPH
jgi:hypothetical protein